LQTRNDALQVIPLDRFLEEVLRWAEARPDLEAIALLGSHARGRARADSDIDLLLISCDVRPYLDDASWVETFGEVDRTEQEVWGDTRSVRVWYKDGREVEFAFAGPAWARVPIDVGKRRVIEGGLRVLTDRTGRLSRLT
jgi:predicted nucleotidyltransferase